MLIPMMELRVVIHHSVRLARMNALVSPFSVIDAANEIH